MKGRGYRASGGAEERRRGSGTSGYSSSKKRRTRLAIGEEPRRSRRALVKDGWCFPESTRGPCTFTPGVHGPWRSFLGPLELVLMRGGGSRRRLPGLAGAAKGAFAGLAKSPSDGLFQNPGGSAGFAAAASDANKATTSWPWLRQLSGGDGGPDESGCAGWTGNLHGVSITSR